MLDSTNIDNPVILWWSQFLKGSFTILQGNPALYHHTCFGPVIYKRIVVTKWTKQCLAWGSMLHTVEAIKQFVNVLGKQPWAVTCCWTPLQKHKNWSSSPFISLSKLANLKNNFPTRKLITFEKVVLFHITNEWRHHSSPEDTRE